MAERRMFAKTIIDSDAFLDMPLSSQTLYFHLSMRADDDGFVSNPRRIQKMIGASNSDFKNLVENGFVLTFDSGVVVIKHWRVHNLIQKDRYHETTFLEEKSTLSLDVNNVYTTCLQNVNRMETTCLQNVNRMETTCNQNVNKMETQVSIGKDSLSKYTVSKKENINYKTNNARACESYDEVFKELEVSECVRNALISFLKHCQINGHVVINEKLRDIIFRLDRAYGNDDQSKIKSLKKAINSGYFDILEGR